MFGAFLRVGLGADSVLGSNDGGGFGGAVVPAGSSGGSGTVQHVAGELFKMMTGIDMVHVPYRGTPAALMDLLAGRADVIFDNVASSIEHIRSGRLRPLAVTTSSRSAILPELPTIGDFVPGFEASTWSGVAAPKDTAAEIIEALNRAFNAGLADPKVSARIADLGGTPLVVSPAGFGRLIAAETEKWAKVVRFSGAKPDHVLAFGLHLFGLGIDGQSQRR